MRGGAALHSSSLEIGELLTSGFAAGIRRRATTTAAAAGRIMITTFLAWHLSLAQTQATCTTSTQLWENELSCLLWYLHLALIITSLVHRASFIHYTIMYEPTQR